MKAVGLLRISFPLFLFITALPAALSAQSVVNQATGQVSFSVSLFDLPGRNGPGVQVGLNYESSVRQNVTTINQDSPTGSVGLGWTLPRERILRMTNGTGNTHDDQYYLYSGTGVDALIPLRSSGGVIEFQTRRVTNYKISYAAADESWTIVNTEGIRYIYGGGLGSGTNTKTSAGSSVEWGVRWGNWIGSGNPANYTPVGGGQRSQEQIAVAWNLSQIVNLWDEKIVYEYDQWTQPVAAGKPFTKSSYLRRIKTTDRTIVFDYLNKTGSEYADPHTEKSEPDAYQERYDTRYLNAISLLDKSGQVLRRTELEYDLLNSGAMTKRLLTAIVEFRADGSAYGPPREFAYWGQDSGDGVSVSKSSQANFYNADKGAVYGALKSVTLPSGAISNYFYDQIEIESGERSLQISSPDNTWKDPHIYYGSDYAVVLWRKNNEFRLSLYDWQGRWVPRWSGSSAIAIPTSDHKEIQVTVESNFFAVAVKNGSNALRLFWRKPGAPGSWGVKTIELGLSSFQLRSGPNFVALRDASRLRRYTFRDTGFQTEAVINLPQGQYTIHKIAASRNFVAALSGGAGSEARPVLALYYHDEFLNWRNGASMTMAKFFPPPGPPENLRTEIGLQNMTLRASESAVALQAQNQFIQESPVACDPSQGPCPPSNYVTLYGFKHSVFRWSEDFSKLARTNLASLNLGEDEISSGVSLVVAGDAVHISHYTDIVLSAGGLNKAYSYRFNGNSWVPETFTNSFPNSVYGIEMMSISERDGASQKKVHVKTYNANTEKWSADQFTYKEDDDRTLTEIITAFFGFANQVLTVVFIESFILDFFLNAAAIGGELGAEWLVHKFVHPDPQIGNGGLNYAVAYNNAYYRGPGGNFASIGTLTSSSGDLYKHPPRIASNAVSYMTKSGGVHHNYVAKFKNGVIYNRLMVEANASTDATLSTNPTDKQPLFGSNILVGYPRSAGSVEKATSITLFRVFENQIKGEPFAYPVVLVQTNDGFDVQSTYYAYDTVNAVFQSNGGKVNYNRVVVTKGTAELTEGFGESFFYTGATGDLPFAPDEDTNAGDAPQYLTGRSYFERSCNYMESGDHCAPASTSATTYQIFLPASINGRQPFFVRPVRQDGDLNGRNTTSVSEYNATTGFLEKTVRTVYNGAGQAETHTTEYERIAEVYTQSRSQLEALNLISPVVRSTALVSVGELDDTTTALQVSPWRNWSTGLCSGSANGRALWAPLSKYVAVKNNPGAFNFETGQPGTATNWLREEEISRVECTYGVVTETLDPAGEPQSIVFDQAYRKPVATFAHSSVAKFEAAYTSLEEYERLSSFQITGTIDENRGHTGLRSIGGEEPSIQFSRFQPNPHASAFVAGAFVRPAPGDECYIHFGDSRKLSPEGTASGSWFYLSVGTSWRNTKNPPVPPAVSCPTGGAIDDFAVYPIDSYFSGAAYDPRSELALGAVKANGQAFRYFYDSRDRMTGATSAAGEMLQAKVANAARCPLNLDDCQPSDTVNFNASRPNQALEITGRGPGAAISFRGATRSEVEAQFNFTKNTESAWGLEEDRLVLAEQNVATLKDTPESSYAVRVRVSENPLIEQAFTKVLSGSEMQSPRSPALADVPDYGLVVYAAGNAGSLYSFNAETGEQIQQLDEAVDESSNIQIDPDGNVIVTDEQGALVTYNFRLQKLWRSMGPQAYATSQAPVSDKSTGLVYARTVNGRLVAVNTSTTTGHELGQPLWIYQDAEMRSEPSLSQNGTVYFTGPQGLYMINSAGEKVFAYDDYQFFGGGAPPVSKDDIVYAQSGGIIYAFEGESFGANRKKKWDTRDSGLLLTNAGPIRIAADGTVLVAQYKTLYAFNASDGSLSWDIEFPENLIGLPAIHASRRIIVSTAKSLYALDPDSGDIQWEYSGPGDPPDMSKFYTTYGSPVVSNKGALYIFDSTKNTLVAYRLRPELERRGGPTWASLYNGVRNRGGADGLLDVRDGPGAEQGPVKISIGSVSVLYEEGTYRFYDGDTAVGPAVESEFSEDWLLVGVDNAALFYAGGRPLLSAKFSHPVSGPLKLESPDAQHVAEFADLLVFEDPRLNLLYLDGAGRLRQAQAMESGENIVLNETLYDSHGRAYIETRPAPSGGRFAYRADFVTGVNSSGVMSGTVADYYSSSGEGPSNDGGYPYYRTQFEANPLSRTTAVGEPGADLAIRSGNPNYARIQYGATSASAALLQRTAGEDAPAAGYLAYQQSLPWGADSMQRIRLANGAGTNIAQQRGTSSDFLTASNSASYDSAGERATTALVPDDYDGRPIQPPLSRTSDPAGRADQTTRTDSGSRQFAYDLAGRVRAISTQQDDRVRYRKYDRIGRLIETGVCNCTMSTARANVNNPQWPTSGYTKRSRYLYDVESERTVNKNTVGRLSEVETANSTQGDPYTTFDSYSYDVAGRVLKQTSEPAGKPEMEVSYEYNAIGDITAVIYPYANVYNEPYKEGRVLYEYDRLGRIAQIGLPPDPQGAARSDYFAAYSYYADGSIDTETNHQGAVSREFQYEPGGRPAGASDQFLTQTYDYKDGSGRYFGRNVQSESFAFQASAFSSSNLPAPRDYNYRYEYDAAGRLFAADNSIDAYDVVLSSNPQTRPSDGYDANGNILHRNAAGVQFNATYTSAKNQIENLSVGTDRYDFEHDGAGRVFEVQKGGSQTAAFSFAPYDSLTLTAKNAGGDLTYRYGAGGRRSTRIDGDQETLYAYGTGAAALMQYPYVNGKNTYENGETIFLRHIYGPTGLIATGDRSQYYFYVKDRLGSTRVVYDESKKVQAYYNYLPFGGEMQGNSAENDDRFRFRYTGQEYDTEISLYNYRARLYDPASARFLTPDPMLDGASPYAYVRNDPINRTDPTGMLSATQLKIIWGVGRTAAHAATGALIGVSIGAAVGDPGKGAWIGAVAGAGVGVLGMTAELGLPWIRGLRGSENLADHPAIFYGPSENAFDAGAGRAGAEFFAESQGIPRALWDDGAHGEGLLKELDHGAMDHLDAGTNYNGRVVVVAHGSRTGRLSWAAGEMVNGTQLVNRLTARGDVWMEVERMDLSICYGCRAGATSVAGRSRDALADIITGEGGGHTIRIRASRHTTSPVDFRFWRAGNSRTAGGHVYETINYALFGALPTTYIDAAVDDANAAWRLFEATGVPP